MIQFLFAVKTGSLIVDDPSSLSDQIDPLIYDKAIKSTEFRLAALRERPKSLVQLAILKMGLASVYLKVRWTINAIKGILPKRAS